MSSAKQRGRADASKGSYNPPSEPLGGLFSTKKEIERTAERREQYREGYYDKKREMQRRKH
jgi:hypothetical protein